MDVMDEREARDTEQDKYHYITPLLQTLYDHVRERLW